MKSPKMQGGRVQGIKINEMQLPRMPGCQTILTYIIITFVVIVARIDKKGVGCAYIQFIHIS